MKFISELEDYETYGIMLQLNSLIDYLLIDLNQFASKEVHNQHKESNEIKKKS